MTGSNRATLIVGARGGIGRAVAAELAAREPDTLRIETARSPAPGNGVLCCDYFSPDTLDAAAAQVAERLTARDCMLTRILICTGRLHTSTGRPERRLEDLEPDAFLELMQVNALGPLLAARAFLPLLPRKAPSQLAAISARVGSIGDNRLGGWYSYRCSKAALNMGFQSLAQELRRRRPLCTATLFHPGTVATPLSAPFQANVKPGRLFSPELAARQFLDVLDARGNAVELAFLDWAGQPVPW